MLNQARVSCHRTEWNGDGLPCILVHGFGDASCVWTSVVRHLTGLRTIAFDLRGHGNSDWDPSQRYDALTMTEDLAEIIRDLGLDRFVLVGHSLGGEVALRYASRSNRLAGLVIVDTGPELNKEGVDRVLQDFGDTPREFASVTHYADWFKARRPLARPDLIEQFAAYNLHPTAPDRFVLKSDPALRQRHENDLPSLVNSHYCRPELWSALARLTCPLLVLRGVGSAVLSVAVARRMVETAATAELSVIALAGHAVMMDNPTAFVEALSAFLEANRLR
jgi:pimeloyl-ACP methyl ester carboxylesterase